MWSHQSFFFFNCSSSHQDEHKYRQDVEDSVSEQRPPAQGDRLQRDESHTHTRACTHAHKSKANVRQNCELFFWDLAVFVQNFFISLPDVSPCVYLSCKDATDSNDDQDIKNGWSHYSAHTHVPFSDKHPWNTINRDKQNNKSTTAGKTNKLNSSLRLIPLAIFSRKVSTLHLWVLIRTVIAGG